MPHDPAAMPIAAPPRPLPDLAALQAFVAVCDADGDRARDEGLPFSAETTPHYLHFAAEEITDGATAKLQGVVFRGGGREDADE